MTVTEICGKACDVHDPIIPPVQTRYSSELDRLAPELARAEPRNPPPSTPQPIRFSVFLSKEYPIIRL